MYFRPDLCTTDKLLELLQWVVDRHRYRVQCGTLSGPAYAEDATAETLILSELGRRGYPFREGVTA